MDNIDKKVINIDYPCIQDIIIRKDETDVCFTISDGQDETKLFLKDGEDVMFTVNIGDVSNIGFGGTDNWGKDRLPIYLDYKDGSDEGDSVFVDTIEIQKLAGDGDWCKCELINDDKSVMYTALSENPYNVARTAYFHHKTQDSTIKRGYNEGRRASKEWCVTVIQDANPNGKDAEASIIFDELISQMNTILRNNGKNQVSQSDTPKTYDYLKDAYDSAISEWDNPNSKLFSEDTYQEVYNYHGNNTEYHELARVSMVAWLMAMCLTELVPSYGTTTNTQTQLFKLAYDMAGGRNTPLYGNYDIHSDVMIARLVASAVYALNRGKYAFSDMQTMRAELGGSNIDAFDWDGLGYKGIDNGGGGMTNLGYLVNSDVIIPSAPGPYANGYDNRIKPYEQGQTEDLFCINCDDVEWHNDNYKTDYDIDSYIVNNYEMGAQTPINVWNSYDKDDKLKIIESDSASRATNHYFFGSKTIKFDGVHNGTRNGSYGNYQYYWFSETNETPTETNEVFEVSGPFADLQAKMFRGNGYGTPTSTMSFFDNVMEIADNSRFPTFHNQYGRRRPCGGAAIPSARSQINGDKLNGMYNIDISCIFADSQEQYNRWATEDGFVQEKPKSYPSGHATMTMTVALLLGQMTQSYSELAKYFKNAYEIGILRTLSRSHWNSDVIYGRLFATFIVPIINAMNGGDFQSQYDNAKNVINNEDIQGDWDVKLYIKNLTNAPIQSTGEIRLYVANHIGVNTYLPGADVTAGALYTFNIGMNDFSNKEVHCTMNGDGYMDDAYNGAAINDIRFYDYRHWNNIDAGYKASLDTSDPRCDTVLKKSGATYIIKIENV